MEIVNYAIDLIERRGVAADGDRHAHLTAASRGRVEESARDRDMK